MKQKNKLKLLAGFSLSALVTPTSFGQEVFDVFFLSDTTGSMGGLISSAQNSSNAIFDVFQTRGDVQFGVGEYRDGNAGDFDFRFNLTSEDAPILSNDRAAVSGAIGVWGASGGGDIPEDNLAGLSQVANGVPWRDGSRRMIFWFGDAPGSDPASDGSTLATTLTALNGECVQVVAVDLNDLDSTGQATTIVTETLNCGLNGGLLEDVSALSDSELNDEIDDILLRLFDEIVLGTGRSPVESEAAARLVGLALSRTMTRDVGGRLSRLRAGEPTDVSVSLQSLVTGGTQIDDGIPSRPGGSGRWHVWGDTYTMTETLDSQAIGGGLAILPEIDMDIYGGTIGVDYSIDGRWAIGLGFGAASGDVDFKGVAGGIDLDSISIMPYVSYTQKNALGQADLYADLMYAYNDLEYDIGGGLPDVDGDSHLVELNAGLNYTSGNLNHGPFVQLRYLDGDIDGGLSFESFATQLGYQVSQPIAINGGSLIPQASLAWEHEFESDQGRIGGISLGDTDEDIFVGTLGLTFHSDHNFSVGLQYQARLGDTSESHYVGLNAGFQF